MSPRDSNRGRSGARRRVASGASTAGRGLAGIARIVLLAIMAAALVQAVAILVTFAVRRSSFSSFPTAYAAVAFALAAVAIVAMLALALNSSFLPGRVVPQRYLGVTFVAVCALGAAAIVVGLLGSVRLGAYVAIEILPAAVGFALLGLVTPGLYRPPVEGAARPPAGDRSGSPERSRQRRGGRGRR